MAVSSHSSPGLVSTQPTPYRMHVSQRYLDLTKQKLELARIPRDPKGSLGQAQAGQGSGVTKSILEPLIDHWTEDYDWRAQEAYFNDVLPQFRIGVNGTRIHFVHRRSASPNAIPLLFVQGWPDSFLGVSRIIDALCNPTGTPPHNQNAVPSFHVVVPSIPGTGFSDALPEDGNNIGTTAEIFDALMKSLGYNQYLAHGTGWGFRICRMIALTHHDSCVAIHTANPEVPPPGSSFGFHPDGSASPAASVHSPTVPRSVGQLASDSVPLRPQTVAYALCDSPTGLLAYIYDAIQPQQRAQPPSPQSSRSTPGTSPGPAQESVDNMQAWSPTNLINWTMIHWLPGPEGALRWLANSTSVLPALWSSYSNVPLAITHFVNHSATQISPGWAEAYHHVVLARRRIGASRYPAWERPSELVLDIRDLAILVLPTFFQPYMTMNVE